MPPLLTLAPGRGPSYVLPIDSDFPAQRQEPIDPAGLKVIPDAIRETTTYRTIWLGLTQDQRDYFLSFFREINGSADQFFWQGPDRVPSPLHRGPDLNNLTVGGAPASPRDYSVQYTWYDPTTSRETKPSPVSSVTIAAGDLLEVTLPIFPNGVAEARIYVEEDPAAPSLQGTSQVRIWVEPIAGIVPGGDLPPAVNDLLLTLVWRLAGLLRWSKRSFERWDLSFDLTEEFYAGA